MPANIQLWDRILRYLLGIVLLTWAIAGGPTWTYVGLYLIFSAAFGSCVVYWILRVNSQP